MRRSPAGTPCRQGDSPAGQCWTRGALAGQLKAGAEAPPDTADEERRSSMGVAPHPLPHPPWPRAHRGARSLLPHAPPAPPARAACCPGSALQRQQPGEQHARGAVITCGWCGGQAGSGGRLLMAARKAGAKPPGDGARAPCCPGMATSATPAAGLGKAGWVALNVAPLQPASVPQL